MAYAPQTEPRIARDGKKYRPRVKGEARRLLAEDLKESYLIGSPIRELAESRDLAFGTVRKLLGEAETPMRPRGDTRLPSPY
ncbi:helix-turn-helix domain-containing protein [Streptomyces sp. 2P-4]|uniref:helix-turn-helix domain-containing protein n=1 Tax=Streptomyces sp. 2P-4 TaxID=2931974 RepID=UPI00253F6642|nr:helix-turn-helix domain-containing protein [Streptomyces sp. 2P-4]